MSGQPIDVRCEYCDLLAPYPEVIEIRRTGSREVFACRDREACDERWFAAHPEED